MFFLLVWFPFILYFRDVLCITVNGNCSKTFPPEQFEVTGDRRPRLYCTLYESKNCRDEALPPQFEGPSVGPPGSMDVDGVLVPDPKNNLSPQMVIQWTAPNNDSLIYNLTGFLIIIRRHDIEEDTFIDFCRLFDLSSDTFDSTDAKLKFKKKMVRFPGGSRFYYKVDIFTLPRSPGDVGVSKYFTLRPFHDAESIPAKYWTPFISYDEVNFTEPAIITVRFKIATSEYEFTQYKVTLLSLADNNNYLLRCTVSTNDSYECQNQVFEPPPSNQTTVQVSFHNISAGAYYIEIQPVDPFRQNDSRCLCRSSRTGLCDTCVATRTAKFTVEPSPLSSSPVTMSAKVSDFGPTYTYPDTNTGSDLETSTVIEPDPTRDVYVVMATVGGSGLGIVLIIILACLVYRKRSCILGNSGADYNPGIQTSNNLQLENTKGTMILIVNTDDHELHRTVVFKLALYLSNICKFKVEYLPFSEGQKSEYEKYNWVINTMNVVNFIIIVNSRIAFETFQSRQSDSSRQDPFNYAISHMQANSHDEKYFQKYVFINFAYTEDKFCIKDFNPNAQFQIPDRWNYFICWLNGVNTRFDVENNNLVSLAGSDEGRDLLESIKRVVAYQDSKPNWYQQRLPICDTDSCVQSQDQDDVFSVSDMGEIRNVKSRVQQNDFNATALRNAETSSSFIEPSDIGTGISTGEVVEQLREVTVQFEAEHCGGGRTGDTAVPPSETCITDASINTMEERLLEGNIKHGTTDLKSPARMPRNNQTYTSKHTSHIEERSDDSYWEAPSTVNSEATGTTSVIVEKLGSINHSGDKRNSISDSNSGLTQHIAQGAGVESTASKRRTHDEDRSDVSSWVPPSSVNSESGTSVIMDMLGSINQSGNMKDSISDSTSRLSKQTVGDSGVESTATDSVQVTASQHSPHDGDRSDGSYWMAPSLVNSEASTAGILAELNDINHSSNMQHSIKDTNSELTKQTVNDSGVESASSTPDTGQSYSSSEPSETSEEISKFNGIIAREDRSSDTNEYAMRMFDSVIEHEARETVGYESDYTTSNSSFHSPSDVDSDVSIDVINQQFCDLNAHADARMHMNTHL